MNRVPLEVIRSAVEWLPFHDVLACTAVSRHFHRSAIADRHYCRTAAEGEESSRRRVLHSYVEGTRGAMGTPRLLLAILSMLTWYLQHSLRVSPLHGITMRHADMRVGLAPTVASRAAMVQWYRTQGNLLKVRTEAQKAQRAVVRQCLVWGFLAWELFSALPLAMYAGVDTEWLKWGYSAVWSVVALELALLLSLFLCVCVRHLTLMALASPREATWTHAFALELIDVAQSMAAVLTSCAFIHVFEFVVTGRYAELSTVYHVLYISLVVLFVWAGCSQLTKTFPHLMITAGVICTVALIALPHCILLAAESCVMRLVVMIAFTPFNAFCICVIVSSFGLDSKMTWAVVVNEGLKEVAYVAAFPSLTLVLQAVTTGLVLWSARALK